MPAESNEDVQVELKTMHTVTHREAAHVLPDMLAQGLDVVFCGTAAGRRSAEVGAYYAGPGNKFWPTLHAIGLTPVRLIPANFRDLLLHGIGLTDIAKLTSGPDSGLLRSDFDAADLERRVLVASPRTLAFNGKRAAATFLGVSTSQVPFGPLERKLGDTELHVLPSTAGLASPYWDIGRWRDFADRVREIRGRTARHASDASREVVHA